LSDYRKRFSISSYQEIAGKNIVPSFAVFAFANDESVVLLLVMRSTSSFGFLETVRRVISITRFICHTSHLDKVRPS
jgi:hypothetical protein